MNENTFSPKGQRYEAPKAEIIEIESQGILCASAGADTTIGGGGTANMGINTGYGW